MRLASIAPALLSAFVASTLTTPARAATKKEPPYETNVVQQAQQNTDYRRVLDTGAKSQLVVMSLPPGTDIGPEEHAKVEQTLVCVSGHGKAIVNGKEVPFNPGDVVVVTPGTAHDFVNTGKEPLKLYTIYTPPNHLDKRVQRTKADAEKDAADQKFGETVE